MYSRHILEDASYHTQYVHVGSVPEGGELTRVVLYVVDSASRGARCEDFPVELTLLFEGPYGV